MKKSNLSRILPLIIVSAFLLNLVSFAQEDTEKSGFEFTIKKEHKATPVKNQYRSGTCWSFSGISFLESELIREGKGEVDLSEMFIVRYTYLEKAIKYARLHGNMNFAGGGQFHDVTNMIMKYGIVPEDAYPGLLIDEEKHIHGELDAVLKGYMDAVIKNKNKKLSNNWINGFNALLDAYLGDVPEKINFEGKEYSPKSFADFLGLKWGDYVNLSSYTHHPFYTTFGIEIPDNWAWGHVYNVPIDELMQVLDQAIDNGFTVGWASDVSEKGFSWPNGYAIVPEKAYVNLSGLEQAKWSKMSKSEREKATLEGKEKAITQEDRQLAFNNYQTTDDHGMHITGIAKNQYGTKFYKVKNSWGTTSHKFDGYFYASESFVKYKTMALLVNKNSIPKEHIKEIRTLEY